MPGEKNPTSNASNVRHSRIKLPSAAGVYAHLDASVLFRPFIILLTALLVGLLVAPQMATQSYPSDDNLLGTPATTNYKAPRDIEVIDEEATIRHREATVSAVQRVYDFDAQLGEKRARAIESAFTTMHTHIEAFIAEHAEFANSRLSRTQEQRLLEELATTLAANQAEFEKTIGVTLKPDEIIGLFKTRYAQELAASLAHVIREVMLLPIVIDRTILEADRELGLTVQRVPDDGTAPRKIANISSVLDIDAARHELRTRMRREFSNLKPAWRDLAISIGIRIIEATLTPNRAATEVAREVARIAVKPVTITVKKGEMIIRDGERLLKRHFLIFRAIEQTSGGTNTLLAALGAALTVLLLIALGILGIPGHKHELSFSSRDVLFLSSLFLAGIATARLWVAIAAALHDRFPQWSFEALIFTLPVAAGAMIARLTLRVNIALWFAVLSSLVLGLVIDSDSPFVLYAMVGAILGATRIPTISARANLLRAGITVGIGQAAAALVIQLVLGRNDLWSYITALPMAFIGGILASLVALAITPIIEVVFGYTTDLKLLELANLNHPALKDLIVQAPGSYHHSIIVGALVEAAAEAIGANPLLARVMAYYHDLGKGINPQYYIENQREGQNPHDKLKPSMSAMIIKRHVSDGLEIANKYRLGETITSAIAEHHGTTLIHYFHHKAVKEAENPDEISENDYRYVGRKPQTREAALVMLGDSVEAAARSVADPTPARLSGVVARIINVKFADEQLEECEITLKDLHLIAKSFSKVLGSIYHTRPEYPEILKELAGKKSNGDSDQKQPKRSKDRDPSNEDQRPDNLRRLGLS
ncbi:MAG: HDIG domain-containing protein [Deltaproteobacteria bacterium]|nr:HDIG domain-containing protein [Deltaproteobacteria bacterium]